MMMLRRVVGRVVTQVGFPPGRQASLRPRFHE